MESVFIVEKVTAEPLPERCRQHYPKYGIRSYERAICRWLAEAEDALNKFVKLTEMEPKGWSEDVFCYYIKEYPVGIHITQSYNWLLSWRLYNAEGEMIDKSGCGGLDATPDFSEFKGRDSSRIRFKKGDVVEFVWGGEVSLGFVVSLPPTKEEVKARNSRPVPATRLVDHTTMDENGEIIITVDLEKSDEPEAETIGTLYPLDMEDDCYVVLTTSDYASHMHINTMDVFAPHYPVPNYMRKRLNESYQKYLKKYNESF